MLDRPPPYTPLPSPSIWMCIVNWMLPSLGVAIDDLRPAAIYGEITLAAVYDIRFCEKIFDDWMTQLDEAKNNSKKPIDRELLLRLYLGRLKEDAGWCSNATNAILKCHVRFASLMAQRIDDASKNQYSLKYDDSETTRLANDIREASRSLSMNVVKMKDNLHALVSILESIQVTVKKERSLAERILEWLKSLYNAIVRFFARYCPPISALLLHSAEPKVQKSASAASTLRKAAETFCAADSEPQEGKESESLDSVILLLKEVVPREAQTANEKLERFDEALYIMGLESRMRAGRRVTLYGSDPAAVAKEWRDLAKQYQSVLPDDEDPVS